MTDQPTQEEIERVRAWQEQQNNERAIARRNEDDARWEENVAGLESLIGAKIVSVEYEREEKANYSNYQGDDFASAKIVFDTGAVIEYRDSPWSESTQNVNIKTSDGKWIV